MNLQLFGSNLHRLITLYKIDQRQAARLLGVSATAVSAWVNAKRPPGKEALIEIEQVFGVDPMRLAREDFVELLPTLVDPERFHRIRQMLSESPPG